MPTPQDFKNRILQRYPDGVASDGKKYSEMDPVDLTTRMTKKFPDGVTSDGIKYTDFLPKAGEGDPANAGVKTPKAADVIGAITGGAENIAGGINALFGPGGMNEQLGMGVAKSAAGTAAGAAKLGISGLNYLSKIPGLGFLNTPEDSKFMQPTKTLEKLAETTTPAEGVGKFGGDVAQFFLPGPTEEKIAMKGLEFIDKLGLGLKTAAVLKTAIRGGTMGASMAPVAAVQSGGDPNAILGASLAGGFGGSIVEGFSQIVKNVPFFQNKLGENISKALGISGKQTTGSFVAKNEKAIEGLKTIADNAAGAIVKDINGAEHAFDPAKATFQDTIQAWQIARDKVYDAYDALAKQAGDEGATFTQKDFKGVIKTIGDAAKNGTAAFKNKAASLIKDIQDNYGTVNAKDGDIYFRDASLKDIQSFLEHVNTDVNPGSDKAGADLSIKAAQKIREILDDKITSATGEGYQALRNQYASLKSIEKELLNQGKKIYRGSGGWFGSYVNEFGTLDAFLGLLRGNVMEVVRGAGTKLIAENIKTMRDPEAALRTAFGQIGTENLISPTMLGKILQGAGRGAPYVGKGAAPFITGGSGPQ